MKSELRAAPLLRIRIEPNANDGLQKTWEIMVDQPQSVARVRIGKKFGYLADEDLLAVSRSLAVFLGAI